MKYGQKKLTIRNEVSLDMLQAHPSNNLNPVSGFQMRITLVALLSMTIRSLSPFSKKIIAVVQYVAKNVVLYTCKYTYTVNEHLD